MRIGAIVTAPQGCGSLAREQNYYFLGAGRGHVALGWFDWSPEAGKQRPPQAHFMRLEQTAFETAILEKSIVVSKTSVSYPPWLNGLEGTNFEALEEGRNEPKRTYRESVNQRYSHIHGLVQRAEDVLFSDAPKTEIGKHARQCSPRQNSTRLATWFLAYRVSGNDLWSLKSPSHRIGTWERESDPAKAKKLGRPARNFGEREGYAAKPMAEKIQDEYYRRAKLGVTMTKIYRASITDGWGCKITKDQRGLRRYYHPQGKPFPTYGQFRYWVFKKFSPHEVQQTLYGEARIRAKSRTSQGPFGENLANLLEATEIDAFRIKERPKCLLLDQVAPPLIVARAICATSGRRIGIGFSFGSETTEAYRSMLFTMVIPGSLLGSLFGLPITNEEWPGVGLPPRLISDRGPGAIAAAIEGLERHFPVRELTPSYAGQSKAFVESSQPRNINLEGAPTYVVSELNVIEMMRREVLRAIAENDSSDVSSRLTLEMKARGVLPTPNTIWNFLDGLLRTSAMPLDVATAIRALLRPIEFSAQTDGLYYQGQCFDSPELRGTRLTERLSRGRALNVRGYVFPMLLRRAWVEHQGKLLSVVPRPPGRSVMGALDITTYELTEIERKACANTAVLAEHRSATKAEAEERFRQATGKRWDSGTRRQGRPPKPTQEARYEASLVSGKKVGIKS